MRQATIIKQLEIFTGSAVLAAHASNINAGFRQRDLRFFLELFMNWSEDLLPVISRIQNTQLARYLSELIHDGYAKPSRGGSAPRYRLTRLGLLEILNRIIRENSSTSPGEFLFLIGFIRGYKERLMRLIAREGSQFPPSLQIEIQAILDVDALLAREASRLDRAIARMETRISDALKTGELVRNRLAAGVSFTEVVREAELKYPYELNSMKPLSELIAEIDPDQQRWELQEGNILRARVMWLPQLSILKEYRRQLQELRQTHTV